LRAPVPQPQRYSKNVGHRRRKLKVKKMMVKKQDEQLFSISSGAKKLRRTRRTIERALEGAKPVSVHGMTKLYTLDQIVTGLDRNTYAPINPQKGAKVQDKQGPTLAGERALLVREQRRALEQRNAKFSGTLFHADKVERAWAEVSLVMREAIMAWPFMAADEIATACGADRNLVSLILEEKARELLEHLADAPDYGGRK
jgi:hypothetical protein